MLPGCMFVINAGSDTLNKQSVPSSSSSSSRDMLRQRSEQVSKEKKRCFSEMNALTARNIAQSPADLCEE